MRHISPPGGSTLMTSAPKSERITAAAGPAMKLAMSTTFNPEKMLSFVIVFSLQIGSAFVLPAWKPAPQPSCRPKTRLALLEKRGQRFPRICRTNARNELLVLNSDGLFDPFERSPLDKSLAGL